MCSVRAAKQRACYYPVSLAFLDRSQRSHHQVWNLVPRFTFPQLQKLSSTMPIFKPLSTFSDKPAAEEQLRCHGDSLLACSSRSSSASFRSTISSVLWSAGWRGSRAPDPTRTPYVKSTFSTSPVASRGICEYQKSIGTPPSDESPLDDCLELCHLGTENHLRRAQSTARPLQHDGCSPATAPPRATTRIPSTILPPHAQC